MGTKRTVLELALAGAKLIKEEIAMVWRYHKVENAPPLTVGALKGPVGAGIESIGVKIADGIIGVIAGQIKKIDDEIEAARLAAEAAVKAAIEKQKAEAKKKEEEQKAAAAKSQAEQAAKAKKKAAEASKPKDEKKKPAETSNRKEEKKKSDDKDKKSPKKK